MFEFSLFLFRRCLQFIALTGACAVVLSESASAQGNWTVQGATALVTMDLPHQAKKSDVSATLLISFSLSSGCAPQVGTLITQGSKLGKMQGRAISEDKMSITVDKWKPYSVETTITKYENGFEKTFFIPTEVLDYIKTGKTLVSRLGAGMPNFEFDISNGQSALNSARAKCLPR